MKTTPRHFRLTHEATLALKSLRQTQPDKSDAVLVSEALLLAANKTLSAPVVRCSLLDPLEHLAVQAVVTQLLEEHHKIRKDFFRLRANERSSAEKIASVLLAAEKEVSELTTLRKRLSSLARTAAHFTPQDVSMVVEQIVPTCKNSLATLETDSFLYRKHKAILLLVQAVFPEVDHD